MSKVDYSKYSLEDLLDVQAHISSQSKNYPLLMAELDARRGEIEERAEQAERRERSDAENALKLIGYLQLAAAAAILLVFILTIVDGSSTFINFAITIIAIAFNAVAGYTLIRQMQDKYWISVLNQAVQIPSVAIGSVMTSYSGLGGVYLYLDWTTEVQLGFSASFSPGLVFLKYNDVLPRQFIAVDLLAIFFVVALLHTIKANAASIRAADSEIGSSLDPETSQK